jgi:23S rRNA (adenine2503-C2)-methyltransferase
MLLSSLQVLTIEDIFRQRVTNIVFMGMGEPLMNLGAVLDAHRTINKVCTDP